MYIYICVCIHISAVFYKKERKYIYKRLLRTTYMQATYDSVFCRTFDRANNMPCACNAKIMLKLYRYITTYNARETCTRCTAIHFTRGFLRTDFPRSDPKIFRARLFLYKNRDPTFTKSDNPRVLLRPVNKLPNSCKDSRDHVYHNEPYHTTLSVVTVETHLHLKVKTFKSSISPNVYYI